MSTSKASGPRDLAQLEAAVLQLTREMVGLRGEVKRLRETAEGAAESANGAQAAANALAKDVVRLRDSSAGESKKATEEEEKDDARWPASWWVVDDPAVAAAMLAVLRDWLERVYVQYDGAMLPACWPWHPVAVAELWALRDAWYAAHQGKTASPHARMDWYDRWRPGVERRLKQDELRQCRLENHLPNARYRGPKKAGVGQAAFADLAAWWTSTRGAQDPPPPTPDMVAAERGTLPVKQY